MTATVAIVGRPNVGKSTLFNRLAQRRLALIDDTPGVTRDWREGEAHLGDLRFRVLDTAGLEEAERESLPARMSEQTERAIGDAEVVLFLIDARTGVTPVDRHFADRLRRRGMPTLLVANKTEGRAGESGLLEGYALGLGEPIAISAEHGEGMAELYDALRPLIERSPGASADPEEDTAEVQGLKPLQLAVVGRPNVGKSTLVNRLIGQERLLTGPEAGITRDAIAIEWIWRGKPVRLIDTAGLRRKAKVEGKLEKLSVADTLRAIRFAEVVVLVIDAETMLERQDLAIARLVEEEGRALVLAVNKWDLVADKPKALERLRDRLEASLPQLQGLSTVTLSAKTGRGLEKLMPAVFAAHVVWNRRIATPALNRWLEAAQARHPPPLVSGRRLRLRYMTQANIRPPTFALFASKPGDLPDSYRGYLVKLMREDFDLPGVPIRMMLRKGKNPYAAKD
ncbi:MAG TPA: ribosome biogenesis GTPase Der [Stellaceae bacterium]|jgi:GTP-binding protein|nr:ribosome biogenesis GTPase Der [Stellaceae bacterium]